MINIDILYFEQDLLPNTLKLKNKNASLSWLSVCSHPGRKNLKGKGVQTGMVFQ